MEKTLIANGKIYSKKPILSRESVFCIQYT